MAAKLAVASAFMATLASALPHQGLRPNPVKRDGCAPTPLGYVTPYPGGTDVVTITSQGQPCTTYLPYGYACNNNGCDTQYSASTYNWYSTYVPCATGMCFVGNGNQMITLPPSPQATGYKIESMYCPTEGYYTAGGQEYYVQNCPTYLYYPVMNSYSQQVCQASDYFQYLYGMGGAGVSELDVDYITCVDGVCTHIFETWYSRYAVGTAEQYVSASFTGFCQQSGPCELSAFISGYGVVSITINVSINSPTVVSTSTSAQVTVTTTATVTETSTRSQTVSVTQTATATQTTTVQPTATLNDFVIAIDITGGAGAARKVRRQAANNRAVGYVSSLQGKLHLSSNPSDALRFGLVDGQLVSGASDVFASVNDVQLGSNDVQIGTPSSGDFSRTWAFNANNVLTFTNAAFTGAGSQAAFCIFRDQGRIIGIYDGVNPAGCTPVTLAARTNATPVSSSSAQGSSTSAPASSTTSQAGASTTSSAGAQTTSSAGSNSSQANGSSTSSSASSTSAGTQQSSSSSSAGQPSSTSAAGSSSSSTAAPSSTTAAGNSSSTSAVAPTTTSAPTAGPNATTSSTSSTTTQA